MEFDGSDWEEDEDVDVDDNTFNEKSVTHLAQGMLSNIGCTIDL